MSVFWCLCASYSLVVFGCQIDSGSVDTTEATISVFVLCMLLNPNVQEKAYAQIMDIVGSERLPTIAEYVIMRTSLSYNDWLTSAPAHAKWLVVKTCHTLMLF